MEKIELKKKPELVREERPSVIQGMTVSPEDSKTNTRYLKAGATVAAYIRGSIPLIVGAAVVGKLAYPLVEDLVDFSRSTQKLKADDDDEGGISVGSPPRKFIKLKSRIAPSYDTERQFARYLKIPYSWDCVMYKIIWEHIRITRSKTYDGHCYVRRHHVRRRMGAKEIDMFLTFVRSLGNVSLNDVLQAQS